MAKWIDPHSVDEWKPIADIDRKPAIIESFGYEIHRDDEVTIISLNYDEAEQTASCTMVIPDICIIEYDYIEVQDVKKR